MRPPYFVGHPNGIVFCVFKQTQLTSSSSPMVKRKIETKMDQRAKKFKLVQQRDEQQKPTALSVTKKSSSIFSSTPTPLSLIVTELKGTEQRTSALSVTGIVPLKDLVGKSEKIRLPSFISHPNGIVLRVFKRQRSRISSSSSEPTFIYHPNGIVLQVLNQQQIRLQSSSGAAVISKREILHALKRKRSSLSSSSSMVKMETETETNRNAEQHVKQLKRVKQRVDRQHNSLVHHQPPQQQYKSKSWIIAIILKLTFVAWDSWTYQIGY